MMKINDVVTNNIDLSKCKVTFDKNGEYDVTYTSQEKLIEVREIVESQLEENGDEEEDEDDEDGEKQMEPKATTNKRKRKNLTFGDVPKFDRLKHAREELAKPILNVPEHVDAQKPNSIFSLFFPDVELEKIVKNTNLYAKKKREEDKAATSSQNKENETDKTTTPSQNKENETDKTTTPSQNKENEKDKATTPSKNKEREWVELNLKDLKTWIAFVIYQGVYKSPELSDYWNRDPRFPIHSISRKMTLVRFEQIKRYLHISSDFNKCRACGASVFV